MLCGARADIGVPGRQASVKRGVQRECRSVSVRRPASKSPKQENRVFHPPKDFERNASISGMGAYLAMHAVAEYDYEGFWAQLARDNLLWHKPFTKTLNESEAPFYKWFEDGQLNVSYS